MSQGSSLSPSRKASDAYHHGDLRSALMAAARESLETMPPEAITLRSLALRLGVSQPAPYRHFESRDGLLASVASEGFVRFHETLRAAVEEVAVRERLERSSLAYLAFGRANKGVYRLMFASSVLKTVDEALAVAARSSFDFLLDQLTPYATCEELYATGVWVWSTLHGLVMLEADGLASGPDQWRVSPEDIVRRMVGSLQGRR